MIVVDASTMLAYLLGAEGADAVRARVAGERLAAPHVLDLEVASALRRLVRRKQSPPARAREALGALAVVPLTRFPHTMLLGRIWQLRDNLSVYDAAYVALAEALDAPLLTADKRIAKAPGLHARIELVTGA